MPDIHSIRLREPWKCEPRGEGVVWIRTFNWPAGLTRREKVWVVVDGLPADARVVLNGHLLGKTHEATAIIDLHNRLEIEVTASDVTTFPFQVRLDIDEG